MMADSSILYLLCRNIAETSIFPSSLSSMTDVPASSPALPTNPPPTTAEHFTCRLWNSSVVFSGFLFFFHGGPPCPQPVQWPLLWKLRAPRRRHASHPGWWWAWGGYVRGLGSGGCGQGLRAGTHCGREKKLPLIDGFETCGAIKTGDTKEGGRGQK